MLAKAIHKLTALSLSLLVLLSTFSFTIEKHFCGDTLIDIAVFTQAEKCSNEAMEIEIASISKKSCCKDEVNLIKGQDELKLNTFEDLKFQEQLFLQVFAYSYVDLFQGLSEQVIPFKDYSPPEIVRDIQVLDEVYLI